MKVTEMMKIPDLPSYSEFKLQGASFEELVKCILEENGYKVYPFGYENFLPDIKDELHNVHSPTAERIRFAPDLFAFSQKKSKNVYLVEVKSKKDIYGDIISLEGEKGKNQIEQYKKYWNDSILIYIISTKHRFYAQKVSNLQLFKKNKEQKGPQYYFELSNFGLFEDFFADVDTDILYKYKRYVNYVFSAFGSSTVVDTDHYFPEDKDADNSILDFIREHKLERHSFEELFREYNKENLISKKRLKIWLGELGLERLVN